jgi:hypothetical protein
LHTVIIYSIYYFNKVEMSRTDRLSVLFILALNGEVFRTIG